MTLPNDAFGSEALRCTGLSSGTWHARECALPTAALFYWQDVDSERTHPRQQPRESDPTRGPKCRRRGTAATSCVASFCNKSQRDVKKLIAGPTVYICDECVDICLDIIAEDRKDEQARWKAPASFPSRRRSRSSSTIYVIGQEQAKKKLAVAVYNHYKRIDYRSEAHGGRRAAEVEHPADRSDRHRQDAAGPDPGAACSRCRSRSSTPPP